MLSAQRVQLGALFVMVLGSDVKSAAIFSGALVDYGVAMVMTIGVSAETMFERADYSILVKCRKNDA